MASSKFFILILLLLCIPSILSYSLEPSFCYTKNCESCKNDDGCPDNYSCRFVTSNDKNGFCYVTPLLKSIKWRIIVSSFLFFISAIFAAGTGGMGSGGLYITIIYAVMNLRPSVSVGVTQAALFGSALAAFILFIRTPHPVFPERSPFDYNILLMMLPALSIGSIFGSYLHVTSPAWFILIFLALVLIVSTFKSLSLVIRLSDSSGNDMTNIERIPSYNSLTKHRPSDPELEILKPKVKIPPLRIRSALPGVWWKFILNIIILLIVIALAFIRTGKEGYSYITNFKTCSPEFWMSTLVPIPALILITAITTIILVQEQARADVAVAIVESELIVNPQRAVLFPLAGLALGIISSLIGFGGVVLISPLFSDLGIDPLILAGTSALINLFSTAIAIANLEVIGLILSDYMVWYAVIAFIGQIIGHLFIHPWVKKLQQPRNVAITVCIVVLLSTVILVTFGIMDVLYDFNIQHNLKFQWFC